MIFIFSIFNPSDAAIPAAVDWAVGTLLGSVATGVAVLAVAFLGFGMLFGNLDWRTSARVVLGIFFLFGAPMIARELMALARNGKTAQSHEMTAKKPPIQTTVPRNAPAAVPYT